MTMEDINALNSKLQSISKTLEHLQGAVVVQEEKIRRYVKEQRDHTILRESLLQNIKDEETALSKASEAKEHILAESDHVTLACECLEMSLSRVPYIIRKICHEYERFSTKKGKTVRSICAILTSNGFWTQQTRTAVEKCSIFQSILRETKQSRGEFCSSEERRLRRELEVEESKLSYLEQCIRDTEGNRTTTPAARRAPPAQVTPPPAPALPSSIPSPSPSLRRPFCPSSHEGRTTTAIAARDPFEDWADRGAAESAGDTWATPRRPAGAPVRADPVPNRPSSSSAEAARKALFPGYKACYPRQGVTEQDTEEGSPALAPHSPYDDLSAVEDPGQNRTEDEEQSALWGMGSADVPVAISERAQMQQREAHEVRVTISTTTVTERTVRTTGKNMSYSTTTAAAPARCPPSAFLHEDLGEGAQDDTVPPAEYSWDAEEDAPLPSFQPPGVPWFREVKRRRVCAALDNPGSGAGAWSGGMATPGAARGYYTPHSRQSLLLPSSAHAQQEGLGRFTGSSALPDGREAEVVDLYDTSGSGSDGEPPSRSSISGRAWASRASGRAAAGEVDRWASLRPASAQAPQASLQRAAHGNPLKERFRTGLDLVQSASFARA